jgi:hypothetical protein
VHALSFSFSTASCGLLISSGSSCCTFVSFFLFFFFSILLHLFVACCSVEHLATQCVHVACHKGGNNIMQAGATLSMTDMRRNGILDVDAVYQVVYSGKGKMYGFGEGCTPKVCHFFLL